MVNDEKRIQHIKFIPAASSVTLLTEDDDDDGNQNTNFRGRLKTKIEAML